MSSVPSQPVDAGHQLTRGYAARMIRRRAVQIVERVGLSRTDCDDVEQELRLHVLRRLDKFDPSIAKWNTFVRVVTERHAATLIERFSRRKGLPDETGRSQDALGSTAIEQMKFGLSVGPAEPCTEDQSDLVMDVQQVVALLPSSSRRICRLLKLHSIAEAARLLGIPRTTLHDRVARLREVFAEAGIKKTPD